MTRTLLSHQYLQLIRQIYMSPATECNFAHVHGVLSQVLRGGDLEGAGPRHDGAVLDGVLHRPQAVPDRVLDLRQAVVRRTLRADLRLISAFN